MGDLKKIITRSYLIVIAFVIVVAIFFLNGPHISNFLKKIILPELEMATGKGVFVKKIHINIFPLFIEAKGLKIFDDDGEMIIFTKKVKAYIELSGLLSRNIIIRRLVFKEADVTADKEKIDEITGNINSYLLKERETSLKVKIKTVEIKQGKVNLKDKGTNSIFKLDGFNGEVILDKIQKLSASAQKISIKKEGWPEIAGDADISLTLKDKAVQINKFVVRSSGTRITGSGEFYKESGNFKTDIDLLVMSVKKIFKLERSGEGRVSASGNVSYADKKILLDLKLSGKFYLQTLMELLKVKKRVEGLIEVKGEIKGPLDNIRGTATAALRSGNLFNVDVDLLKCNVSYDNGTMKFSDGEGRLYNGSAKVSAAIRLPVVNFYTLDIDFLNIDSIPIFKLIGWNPEIQPGKVKGVLSTSSAGFNPKGWFEYKNSTLGDDVLGRISNLTGKYNLQDSILSLSDLKISTGKSVINVNGIADIKKKSLNFDGFLKTTDTSDISLPYYSKLQGRGEFSGKIKGTFDDPVINGKIKVFDPIIENYNANTFDADITYKKDILNIREVFIRGRDEMHKLDGNIYFRESSRLFDLRHPEYHLNATFRNADFNKFARIFYSDFNGYGRLNADLKISGSSTNPQVRGDALVREAVIYKVPSDSVAFQFRYLDKKLDFKKMKIRQGKSVLNADAVIETNGKFSYKANSDRLLLSDMIHREIQGDIIFSVKTEGHGTFDNPSVLMDVRMISGTLKGRSVGSGVITASIKNKNILVNANMFGDKINITAKGRLENNIPWDAKAEIKTGRYDSFINPFLKDVPEDLILNLNGTVLLHGDKKHVAGTAEIKHVVLSMYGYSFTNSDEIKLGLNDRQLDLNRITLKSGNTSLGINGSLIIGKQYNLNLEGSSALSPFRSLSNRIGVLKGDADFVLSITGSWDAPRIDGGLNLSNGSFGLKGYYYIFSSLNGYIYMDSDRVVLKKLVGKVGGGDVEISGIVYLKKFSYKRFYVEVKLDNITTSVSNDFSVNFEGNILYKGTPDSQMVSGDIRIKRAKYKERVEWKSWLLTSKQTEKYKAEISNLEKAELNIKVTGKDNILIDNNVARATVSADMLLRGTIYNPLLFGRIETTYGTVYFRNNEFRILNASADFSDQHRFNPILGIASETIVKGYKIKMNLEGQIGHFNVSLSSEPQLKEMDILALLATGQTGRELKGLEGSVGASEATSFVTGKLQDVVEERVRTITGLDRLQIAPHVSRITGTVEPRVTVSKRLLGDKLFVTYTTAVGSKEEQILKLEYFLGRNTSLVGVRDERGILGGDVRLRFEFK